MRAVALRRIRIDDENTEMGLCGMQSTNHNSHTFEHTVSQTAMGNGMMRPSGLDDFTHVEGFAADFSRFAGRCPRSRSVTVAGFDSSMARELASRNIAADCQNLSIGEGGLPAAERHSRDG